MMSVHEYDYDEMAAWNFSKSTFGFRGHALDNLFSSTVSCRDAVPLSVTNKAYL